MNFGASTIAAQASRPLSLLAVLSLLLGCGGGYQPAIPAPADPAATIRAFLAAATANNLRDMSALWGTERGPAERSIPRDDLEKRLTVMRTYLQHDSYEILPSDVPVPPPETLLSAALPETAGRSGLQPEGWRGRLVG